MMRATRRYSARINDGAWEEALALASPPPPAMMAERGVVREVGTWDGMEGGRAQRGCRIVCEIPWREVLVVPLILLWSWKKYGRAEFVA